MDRTPIYQHSASYAAESNELPQYRASQKANIACKEAIEAAIRENYDGHSLDSNAAWTVIEQFGFDRPLFVLANTIQNHDWDGRYSNDVKSWAKTVPIVSDDDSFGYNRRLHFIINSHPGLLNMFTQMIRKEQREMERVRPSIRQKLERPVQARASKNAIPTKGQER